MDKKSIVVSKASDSKDFDEFLAELPEKTPRFAVYDYEYSLSESEGTRNKLVFVYWCPDEANVREKMLYSSSKQAIHSRLDGIHINVQATDSSEVTKDVFFDKATRP